MKKFMLIFRGPDYNEQEYTAEENQEVMGKWFAWVDELKAQDRYVAGDALLPTGKVVKRNHTVTDGPYAESKELVGGFFVIRATDIADAIAHCDGFPDYGIGGSVEVREVVVFDM
ncbi:MAG: YciI family protein [Rhodothermales bacterium]|nr:YciI family protein [Rhodothermales bacterium]